MCFQCAECGEVSGGQERAIHRMVEFKIALIDGGRDLIEFARELPPDLASKLHDIHARMIRIEADDENDLQNIIRGIDRHVELEAV